jgi:succinoglycan biosynthesis protein ExoM
VRWQRFWSVLPQTRAGRPFVHATSNVLVDLAALRGLPRPLFNAEQGLSGGGDLVFFSRLFARGVPMAWAEDAVVREAVPPVRASLAWLARRRRRVGNHMVMDEEARHGRLRPLLKTAALLARLPLYPLLGREPEAPLLGWRLEAAKLGGRLAAHRGLRSYEYARDGASERRIVRS